MYSIYATNNYILKPVRRIHFVILAAMEMLHYDITHNLYFRVTDKQVTLEVRYSDWTFGLGAPSLCVNLLS